MTLELMECVDLFPSLKIKRFLKHLKHILEFDLKNYVKAELIQDYVYNFINEIFGLKFFYIFN